STREHPLGSAVRGGAKASLHAGYFREHVKQMFAEHISVVLGGSRACAMRNSARAVSLSDERLVLGCRLVGGLPGLGRTALRGQPRGAGAVDSGAHTRRHLVAEVLDGYGSANPAAGVPAP